MRASVSLILYTPASSARVRPTMTLESVGKAIPHKALSRSPGDSFDAQPAPATVFVSCGMICSVMIHPYSRPSGNPRMGAYQKKGARAVSFASGDTGHFACQSRHNRPG